MTVSDAARSWELAAFYRRKSLPTAAVHRDAGAQPGIPDVQRLNSERRDRFEGKLPSIALARP